MMNKLGKWKAIPLVFVFAALLFFVRGTFGEGTPDNDLGLPEGSSAVQEWEGVATFELIRNECTGPVSCEAEFKVIPHSTMNIQKDLVKMDAVKVRGDVSSLELYEKKCTDNPVYSYKNYCTPYDVIEMQTATTNGSEKEVITHFDNCTSVRGDLLRTEQVCDLYDLPDFNLISGKERTFLLKGKVKPRSLVDWKIDIGSFSPDWAWWNSSWEYSKNINITALGTVLQKGATVNITIDTTDDNKFLDNGDDLRIVYNGTGTEVELNRSIFNNNSATTVVEFKIQTNLSAGSNYDYWAYYGNPSASNPPANWMGVYVFGDDGSQYSSGDNLCNNPAYYSQGGNSCSACNYTSSNPYRGVGMACDVTAETYMAFNWTNQQANFFSARTYDLSSDTSYGFEWTLSEGATQRVGAAGPITYQSSTNYSYYLGGWKTTLVPRLTGYRDFEFIMPAGTSVKWFIDDSLAVNFSSDVSDYIDRTQFILDAVTSGVGPYYFDEFKVAMYQQNNITLGAEQTLNFAPTVSISIAPSTVYTNTWVNVTGNYADPNNDIGTLYFNLTANGNHVAWHTAENVANGSSIIWTVDPANWSKGNSLNFTITACDAELCNSTSITTTVLNSAPNITWYNASSMNRTAYEPNNSTPAFQENETVRFAVDASDADNDNLIYSWLVDNDLKDAITSFFNWATGWFTGGLFHNVTAYVNDSENTTYQYWNVYIQDIPTKYWTVKFDESVPGNNSNVTTAPINISIEITPTPTSESETVTVEHYNSTHFNGDYTNTTYDDGVKLVYANLTGTYTSEIYNATENTIWDNLTWNGHTFAGGELEPTAGMVALWHMNQNWSDVTGGNDGTAYGQANFTTDAKHGSHAGNFDGNGDYALIADTGLPTGNNARTVEAWIKTRNTVGSGEYRGIFSYGTASTGQYFGLAVDNHTLYFDSWGGGSRSIRGNLAIDNSNWHHVAFTYNGSTAKLYVDGILDAEKTLTTPNTALTGTGKIAYYAWASAYHNGHIDELTIWNKTLTPEEIQQHYQGQTGTAKLQVRSCDDALCDGENFTGPTGTGSYYDTPGTFNLNLDSNQWFQYKAYLETNDANQTPKLYNVTVRGEIPAEVPTINISNAWIVFDEQQYNMSGSGLHWSWQSPTLDKGTHNFTAYASDTYGNTNHTETRTVTVPSYDITFNVTSGEDGSSRDNVNITSCTYSGFNQSDDPTPNNNPYGPYAFPTGQWTCTFADLAEEYYVKTLTFTADSHKNVSVVLEDELSMTIQEHDWLREVYECVVEGDCTAYSLWQSTNTTVSKIWNEYLPTDESVVLQEDNISSTLSSSQNITYNYTLMIPFKEGYANGDMLPVRIFYWFTDADNKCYSQDKQADANNAESPYCVPLVATYLGPNNGTVSFTVDLRPDLPAGSYRVVRQIDIDPVENGEPVWITYGRNIIGTIKVLGGDNQKTAEEEEVVEPGHTVAKGIQDVQNKITGGAIKNVASQTSFILGLLVAFLVVSISANAYHTFSRKKR